MRLAIERVAPGSEDLLLPSMGSGDIGGSLRSGNEDEVETALKIVGLQGAANGGRDLEGRFAEGDGSEGDAGGGYETYRLYNSKVRKTEDGTFTTTVSAYSERRKDG